MTVATRDGRTTIQSLEAAAAPIPSGPLAEGFYADALGKLNGLGLPFLVGGTYAVSAYTGISRPTKDLDIFCKAGDYPRIINHFNKAGYRVEVKDERWLAKVREGDSFFDLIFASSNGAIPVDDHWFQDAREMELFGSRVRLVGPTELFWSKAFIQLRHRYDGADVAHLILKQHQEIDWHRLLDRMEVHWEVLLVHLMNFRWIYPAERAVVPRWLMDELLGRLRAQLDLPVPQVKVCRGRLLSQIDYAVDVEQWGYVDVGGDEGSK